MCQEVLTKSPWADPANEGDCGAYRTNRKGPFHFLVFQNFSTNYNPRDFQRFLNISSQLFSTEKHLFFLMWLQKEQDRSNRCNTIRCKTSTPSVNTLGILLETSQRIGEADTRINCRVALPSCRMKENTDVSKYVSFWWNLSVLFWKEQFVSCPEVPLHPSHLMNSSKYSTCLLQGQHHSLGLGIPVIIPLDIFVFSAHKSLPVKRAY